MEEKNAQCNDKRPFIDTPLLAAKRRAFDNPTQANLDALIAEARAGISPAVGASLPVQIAEAIIERGKQRCSGHILILTQRDIEEVVAAHLGQLLER